MVVWSRRSWPVVAARVSRRLDDNADADQPLNEQTRLALLVFMLEVLEPHDITSPQHMPAHQPDLMQRRNLPSMRHHGQCSPPASSQMSCTSSVIPEADGVP